MNFKTNDSEQNAMASKKNRELSDRTKFGRTPEVVGWSAVGDKNAKSGQAIKYTLYGQRST